MKFSEKFDSLKKFLKTINTLEILFIVLGLFLIHIKYYINEDGYVYFRYVKNIWAGNGIVYNVNEFVEGYTSPLWLLLLTTAGWFFNTLLATVYSLGLFCGLISFLLISLIHRRVLENNGYMANHTPYVLALFVSSAPITEYFTTGLEFPLVMLLTIIYGYLVLTEGETLTAWAVVLALGPLVRPDVGGILSIGGILFFIVRKKYRAAAILLTVFLTFNGLIELFRIYYYASLLPNTGYLKSGLGADYARGLDYYLRAAIYGFPWFFLFSLGINWLLPSNYKRQRYWLLFTAFLLIFYLLRVGDYFQGRLILAPFILIILSLAGTLEELAQHIGFSSFNWSWKWGLPIVLFAFNFLHMPLSIRDLSFKNPHGYAGFSNYQKFTDGLISSSKKYTSFNEEPGLYFFEEIAKKLKVDHPITVITDLVRTEFYNFSGVNFVNYFGLTDNVISHVQHRTYLPGHDKAFPLIVPYILLKNIDFLDNNPGDSEWLKVFSIPLQFQSPKGLVINDVILTNFDETIIKNLKKISPVSGTEFRNRVVKLSESLVAKKNNVSPSDCDAAYFLIVKAKEILNTHQYIKLVNWYQNQCLECQNFETYLSKYGGDIEDLIKQSNNEHKLWENFKLAFKLHNKKISPYYKEWIPDTGLHPS